MRYNSRPHSFTMPNVADILELNLLTASRQTRMTAGRFLLYTGVPMVKNEILPSA